MAERKLPGSFRLQLLALLLAFLGALGLLAQAYGRSALLSQKAEQLNLSVGLARNGAEAFAGCGSLTSLSVPGSVRTIGDGAFRDCVSITSVMIPDGVTEIGNYVFRNCRGLTAVVLPETLERIGRYAFSYCSKLETLRIPAAVTEIGTEAFSNCGMWSVTFQGDAPAIGENAFKGVQATAFYPQDAQGWNRKATVSYGGNLTWETI